MNKELWDSQRSGDQKGKVRRKSRGEGEGMPTWAEGEEGEETDKEEE